MRAIVHRDVDAAGAQIATEGDGLVPVGRHGHQARLRQVARRLEARS